MCGRTACSLNPKELCQACQYQQDKTNKQPDWTDKTTSDQSYRPSHNTAPGQFTPVLTDTSHFRQQFHLGQVSDRLICPMKWGLVPSWHKGPAKEFDLKMNNARVETLLEKSSFSKPLMRGQRCVVLADGFYEWKTASGTKQPYFIYFPENKQLYQDESWNKEPATLKPLTMAGLFDVHHDNNLPGPLYSYSIITVASSEQMKPIHHRMPAILSSDQEITSWLSQETSSDTLITLLQPYNSLAMHPVSTYVNQSRNDGVQCVRPVVQGRSGKRQKTLDDFFTSTTKKSCP